MTKLVRIIFNHHNSMFNFTQQIVSILPLITEDEGKIIVKSPDGKLFSAIVREKEYLDFETYYIDDLILFKGGE